MADKDDIDYRLAHRELHDAMNELRKIKGELPLTYIPFDLESCSFCGKKRAEVRRLLAGPGVGICDECVSVAHKVLNEQE